MKRTLALFLAVLILLGTLAGLGLAANQTAGVTPYDQLSIDLNKSRVGVMTGSTNEQLVREQFKSATVQCFDSTMDAVTALKAGHVEVVVTGFPNALNVNKNNRDLKILPDVLQLDDTAIAVQKENVPLLDQLNAILSELTNDGTLADMQRRWLKEDFSPYELAELNVPQTGTPLRVAVDATREPFCFKDVGGRVSGFDGELAKRIAVKLGRPVQFYDAKFAALIPALQSGKADVIISMMSITEERKKSVSFTIPYYKQKVVMLVRAQKGSSETLTLEELKRSLNHKKIGILEGSIFDVWAQTNLPEARIEHYNIVTDLYSALKSHKVDAILNDTVTTMKTVQEDRSIELQQPPLFYRDIAVGVKQGNTELAGKINEYIAQATKDGTLAEMEKRWLYSDTTPDRFPDTLVPVKSDKVLRVAMCSSMYPFVFKNKDGNIVGFDAEFATRLGNHLGMQLEISDMNFAALIPTLASGKADVIITLLTITPERAQKVLFTDPYVKLPCSSVVLADANAASAKAAASSSFFKSVKDSFYSNIILENRYMLIIDGLKVTLIITLLSCIVGTLLGALVCFMRMSRRKVLKRLAQGYIALLRGTPVLVLLMFIFYVVFASVNINPVLVAVIAFAMNFAAYSSEMFRAAILSIDQGQTEAGIAGGFTGFQTFVYIILPQAIKQVLPVYKGELISLAKMTSIVGYIAVQDLTKASDIIRSRTFDAFFPLLMIAVLYFMISWLLLLLLEGLERKTDPKRNRKKVLL